MKATEAAKLADVMQRGAIIYAKDSGGNWRDRHGYGVNLNEKESNDYTPLVPLKTYKVGDMVTFAEALQSGMCFQGNKCKLVYLFRNIPQENRWFSSWSNATMEWIGDASPFNWLTRQNFTIVPDPSIPPKPTIADLEFGTMFKAKNYAGRTLEFIKGNNRFISDNDVVYKMNEVGEFKLTHIKRDGEWEEV